MHWLDENALLRSFLLGDWGTAIVVAGPADLDGVVRVDTKILGGDVSMFVNTLIGLNDACLKEIEEENDLVLQALKLRNEALEFARHGYDISISRHIADRLLPMVEEAIERLQKDDPMGLRWTRSVDYGDLLTFTGSEEENMLFLLR